MPTHDEHLATLGVVPSVELALDVTITPETLARSQPGIVGEASVGPLPRIALSGMRGAPSVHEPGVTADLEILGLLGEGGMGRVHLARQRSLGREVAIKTLKDEANGAHASEMLRAEATIMGRLEHPNVVPVHAVGIDDTGRLVLVMKRIDGAPWRDLMRDADHPRWPSLAPRLEDRLDAHVSVLVQVCNALALAHQRGVIHRDIKPENVLLGSHGEVYLADWGVALRTDDASGQDLVGTPAYMAPEMIMGLRSKIDARSDVFLLGATLHELLVGTPPNQGPTLHAALLAAMEPEPITYDASVPSELAAIAKRAMARDPKDRFASALDVRRALDEVRNHRGSIALTRIARVALSDLETTLSDASASRDGVDRKLTECRFALTSALREWPGNDDARRALSSCLRLAIGHELARENASAARALLEELDANDPALAIAVSELEARVRGRDGELARLRSIDADGDIRVGVRARALMFATFAALAMGVSAVVLLRSGGESTAISAWEAVRFAMWVFAAFCVLVLVFGRALLANAVGRRITWLLALATGGLVVHRVIAALQDQPTSATLTADLVLLGLLAAASGTVLPRGAWSAVPAPIGIVAAIVYPEHVPVIFSVCTLMISIAIMVIGGLEIRARATAAAPLGSADRRPSRGDDTKST